MGKINWGPSKIDNNSNELSMYDWPYEDIPIDRVIEWLNVRKDRGKKTVRLELIWGYDDIDEINLITK